ncbi:RNA helicase [Coprinopsis cinerea AmutBmut pab1-1]|nr:RNA helicase [Coprinopsis cinerea AmutBmut pab1-1]
MTVVAPTINGETISKEERKRLKKLAKQQAKEAAAANENVEPQANGVESKKKEKKDKKKKEKKEKSEVKDESGDGDAMAVDTPMNGESKEDKKEKKKEKKDKKKKEKEKSSEAEGEPMLVDSTEWSSKEDKKEKKKRKREAEADEPVSKESKKEKKKRRKEGESSSASAEASSSSTPAAEPSSSSSPTKFALSAPTTPKAAEEFLAKHSITITLPEGSSPADKVLPVVSFDQLSNLPQRLREEAFKGFKEPSPIQACTWPPALEGKDVVGIAETGSGKTLAFGIPALNRLISSPSGSGISTLIVAPTRELAIQTHDNLSALAASFGIASVAIFGGVSKDSQIKMLKKSISSSKSKKGKGGEGGDGLVTRIVVGTPGRILDLMQDGVLDLSGVDYLVLDEADRMLDKGFENDIRRIIAATKKKEERQTMMFSATWPEAVRRLASTFQRDPVRVTVGSDDLTANSRVEQVVEVFDDVRSKDQRLNNHLRALLPKNKKSSASANSPLEISRILVFALYKKEASRVEEMLKRQGYTVGALHGDMSQSARMEALDNFKTGKTQLLVATDVAARGLDIPNVGAVINYTFPLTIEDYIHRIGRTGRGGKTGKSITFFTGENHERSLAGEFARVLSDGGFDNEQLKAKFPMTIKKKEHSVYGAFYRDDIPAPKGPTKITF